MDKWSLLKLQFSLWTTFVGQHEEWFLGAQIHSTGGPGPREILPLDLNMHSPTCLKTVWPPSENLLLRVYMPLLKHIPRDARGTSQWFSVIPGPYFLNIEPYLMNLEGSVPFPSDLWLGSVWSVVSVVICPIQTDPDHMMNCSFSPSLGLGA